MSLSHSGSTVLDLMLSRHEKAVGLGEVHSVFKRKQATQEGTESTCSCGEHMNACELWTQYKITEEAINPKDYKQKYEILFHTAPVNESEVVVDSSKEYKNLDTLHDMHQKGEIELHVIFLIKDVRSWAVSVEKAKRRSGKPPSSYLTSFLRWYKRNKRIERHLQGNKIPYTQIGYDELCFHQKKAFKKIFSDAELSSQEFSMENQPTTHIAYGNRTKKEQPESGALKYDDRWVHNYRLNFMILLLPFVFSWNKRNVYGNID